MEIRAGSVVPKFRVEHRCIEDHEMHEKYSFIRVTSLETSNKPIDMLVNSDLTSIKGG